MVTTRYWINLFVSFSISLLIFTFPISGMQGEQTKGAGSFHIQPIINPDSVFQQGINEDTIQLEIWNQLETSVNVSINVIIPHYWNADNVTPTFVIDSHISVFYRSIPIFVPENASIFCSHKISIKVHWWFEDNHNYINHTFNLTISTPDYKIINKTIQETSVITGDNIDFISTIINYGEITGINLTVQIYLDNVSVNTYLFPEISVNENVEINTTWIATTGEHTLRVVVDPDNETWEYNESDNEISYTFTVKEKEQSLPWLWLGVVGVLGVVALVGVSFWFVRKRKK